MDGIHDMGGMHGFGKVEPEPNEPVFHADWEAHCLVLNRAMGFTGIWTIDQTRAGIEELPPELYLASSYYKKWAIRLENLVVARGLAGADEIAAGHALRPGTPVPRTLKPADVDGSLSRGSFRARAACRGPLQAGRPGADEEHPSRDPYQAAALCPRPHRRRRGAARLSCIPRHRRARAGRRSTMALHHPIRWPGIVGRGADPTLTVSIEAFEPYLEPA